MKHLKLLAAAALGFLVFLMLGASGHSAAAGNYVTSTFPRASDQPGYLFINEYHSGAHLNTPDAALRVFYDTTSSGYQNHSNFTVTVGVICRGGSGDPDAYMELNNSASLKKVLNVGTQCEGKLDTTPDFSVSQSFSKSDMQTNTSVYGADIAYVDLDIWVSNNKAAIGASVTANNGGGVTFQEVPQRYRDTGGAASGIVSCDDYTGNAEASYKDGYPTCSGTPYTSLTQKTAGGNAYALLPNADPVTYDLYFSPSCDVESGTNVYLRWYDADASDGTNETYTLKMALKDITSGKTVYSTSDANTLGNDDSYRQQEVSVNPGDTYEWVWSNVAESNGIQVWMPFSEESADISCSWNLSGSSKVSASTVKKGDTVTFNHQVAASSSSGTTASYSWQVQACTSSSKCTASKGTWKSGGLPGSSGTISCPTGGSDPNPNDCPSYSANKAQNTTGKFPLSGMSSGDYYCQRIEYSPPSGPGGTGTGYSSPACVQYKPAATQTNCKQDNDCPTSGPSISGSCDGAGFNIGNSTHLNGKYDSKGNPEYDNAMHWALWVWSSDGQGAKPPSDNATTPSQYASKTYPNGVGDPYWATTPSGTTVPDFDIAGAVATGTDNNGTSPPYYDLDAHNQIMSGTVDWELVTFNPISDGTGDGGYWYWLDSVTTSSAGDCYEAGCSISIDGGLSHDGWVKEAESFTVTVTMNNTGANDIPATMYEQSYPLSATWSFDGGTRTEADVGADLLTPGDGGAPLSTTFTVTAPSSLGSFSFSAYPDYYGRGPLTSAYYAGQSYGCSDTVTTFEQVHVTPNAVAQPAPGVDDEDLTSLNYEDWGTADASVSDGTTACTYYQPVGQPTPDNCSLGGSDQMIASGGGYAYTPNSDTTASTNTTDIVVPSGGSGEGTYAPTSLQAGDQYCSYMDVAWTSAWTDASGDLAGEQTDPSTDPATNCVTVTNKPFFKVFDGGVEAGSGFAPSCSGGGELAGWNNDSGTYPDYGASADLTALSLANINGFASNQSAFGNAPGNLSLANKDSSGASTIGSSAYNASMGGNFDAPEDCLTPPPSDTATTPPGGTYTLSGFSAGSYQQVISIKGNVVITGNVIYPGDGSWTLNNVPSLTVYATGNIYIDSNVTELDGTYIAGGHIYTCTSGTTPLSATTSPDMFNGCNKQLVVYGSFVAPDVDLMRTFGSLRDEKPNPPVGGTPGTPGTPAVTVAKASVSCQGNNGNNGSNGSIFDVSCSTTDPTTISYTINGNNTTCATVDVTRTASNGTVVASVVLWWDGSAGGYFYSSSGGCESFNPISGFSCGNDYILNYLTCTFPAKTVVPAVPGTPGTPATPATPHIAKPCSNQPTTPGYTPGSPQTCAAEVFYQSPEIYLSQPPGDVTGKPQQYDAITSLPPVL